MTEQNPYIVEGIQQARQARDLVVGHNWADSWKNYAVNYALQRQQQDYDLQLWNLMNEYNSPAEQMKRYKEAGLNPMLAYTQGSPGNASGPANSPTLKADIHPGQDNSVKVAQAAEIIGMVTNMAQNVAGLVDSGMNLQLKKNQVAESNFDRRIMEHAFPYTPGQIPGVNYAFIQENLNPLSNRFDPLAYIAFQKKGMLPQFMNQYLTSDMQRGLLDFKTQYQKYYNENLLPKFNEYQQGKIDLQEIEKGLNSYEYDVMQMIPAPVRGIVEPLVQYLSPFLKFIFKRSTVQKNR